MTDTPMTRLLQVMARLRDPERGCPWDLQQDSASIAPYTIEEAYEVADSIEQGDDAALREELGDLLFQVVFHARLAEERGAFDFDAVAESIAGKLERRHPHVFGDTRVEHAEEQGRAWERHKEAERRAKGDGGVLDGVPRALPALTRTDKLGRRAARVGFDWPDLDRVLDKVVEESLELGSARGSGDQAAVEHEIGDLMLALANVARHLGVDPELALRRANDRFEARFREIERVAAEEGVELSSLGLDDLEARWQAAKRRLDGSS